MIDARHVVVAIGLAGCGTSAPPPETPAPALQIAAPTAAPQATGPLAHPWGKQPGGPEPGPPPSPCVDLPDPPRPDAGREKASETAPAAMPADKRPAEEVQATIRRSNGEFQRCYEAGLARNRDLTGRVGVKLVVGPDGRVMSAQVIENDLPDCAVVACVRNTMKRIVFSRASSVMTIIYPIMLEPAK